MNSKILGSSLILEFDVDEALGAVENDRSDGRDGKESQEETDAETSAATAELDPIDDDTIPSTQDETAEGSQASSPPSSSKNKRPTSKFQEVYSVQLIPDSELKERLRFHAMNLQQVKLSETNENQRNRHPDQVQDHGVDENGKETGAKRGGVGGGRGGNSMTRGLEHVSTSDANRALIKRGPVGRQREQEPGKGNSSPESTHPAPPALVQQQHQQFSSQSLAKPLPSTPEATSFASLIPDRGKIKAGGENAVGLKDDSSPVLRDDLFPEFRRGTGVSVHDQLPGEVGAKAHATDQAAGRVGRTANVKHAAGEEAGDGDDEEKGERALSGAGGDRKSEKNAAFSVIHGAKKEAAHDKEGDCSDGRKNNRLPVTLDRKDWSRARTTTTRRQCKQDAEDGDADDGEEEEEGRRMFRFDHGNDDAAAGDASTDRQDKTIAEEMREDRREVNNLLRESGFLVISSGLNGQNGDLNEIRDQMRQEDGKAGRRAIRNEEATIASEIIEAKMHEDLSRRIRGAEDLGGDRSTTINLTREVFSPRPIQEMVSHQSNLFHDQMDLVEKRLRHISLQTEQKVHDLRLDMNARLSQVREEYLTAMQNMHALIVTGRTDTSLVIEKINNLREDLRQENKFNLHRLEQAVSQSCVGENLVMITQPMNKQSDMQRITKLEAAVNQRRQLMLAPKHQASLFAESSPPVQHKGRDAPFSIAQQHGEQGLGATDADTICGQIFNIKSQQELLAQQVCRLIQDMDLILGEQRNAFKKQQRGAADDKDDEPALSERRDHEAEKSARKALKALQDPPLDSGVEKRTTKPNPPAAANFMDQVTKGSEERRSSSNDIFNGGDGRNFLDLQKQKDPGAGGRRMETRKGNKRPLAGSKLGCRGKVLRRTRQATEEHETGDPANRRAGRYCTVGNASHSSSSEQSVSMGSDCESSCQISSTRMESCAGGSGLQCIRNTGIGMREQGKRRTSGGSRKSHSREAKMGIRDPEKLPLPFLQSTSPIFRWKHNVARTHHTRPDVRRDSLSFMLDQPDNHITAGQFAPRVTSSRSPSARRPRDIKHSSLSLLSSIRRTTARLKQELSQLEAIRT